MSLGVRRLPLWVLLGLLLLQPTPHRVSQTVAGDLGDSMFLTWTLSWGAHALRTDPLDVFDANIFHPEPQTLALSDPMLSLAPIHGLVEWVTGDAVVALNVVMFVLFVGALAAAHALAMRLFGRGDVALVVAVVACCNSYVFGQQNHPQLQTFGFVSLCFLLLLRALEYRRPRDGVWLGLAIVAMTLANVYYGLFWVLSALVVVGVLRLRGALASVRELLPAGLAALGVVVVLLGPVMRIYVEVDERNGLARAYEPANSLFPTDLITPQADNWLWGDTLDGINSSGKAGEHSYFPGFSAMALGVVGAAVGWRMLRRGADVVRSGVRVDEVLALVVAGAVAIAFAVGPSPGGIPGPFRLLHGFVPGFDGVRVTARFTVVAFIALALLVGLAFQVIADRVAVARRGLAAAALAALVVLEVGGPMARVDVPEGDRLLVYQAIADAPPGPVAELPIRVPADGFAWPFVEAPRMYHATTDWNPRVNGYSGSAPAGFATVAARLNTWPSADAEALADELGLRYVVLHGGIENGTPALSSATQAEMVAAADALGYRATRHGEDWLIVRW